MRTYSGKAFTNFRVLNVPEDYKECESFKSFIFILYLSTKTNSTCKNI